MMRKLFLINLLVMTGMTVPMNKALVCPDGSIIRPKYNGLVNKHVPKYNGLVNQHVSHDYLENVHNLHSKRELNNVPLQDIYAMASEKRETLAYVVDGARKGDVIHGDTRQYNQIVEFPQSIKNCFEGKQFAVPVDGVTVFKRVGSKVMSGAGVGALVGFGVAGVVGGIGKTASDGEQYEINKHVTREDVFNKTFDVQYPQVHGKHVWQSAEKADCMQNITSKSLIEWGQSQSKFGDIKKAQNDDFGTFYGQEMKNYDGNFIKAFPAAVESYCFNKHNTADVQNDARKEASQLAAIVAEGAVQNLIVPSITNFSWEDAQKGGLIGLALGGAAGGMYSIACTDDVTRPIETEIPHMNKKI